MHLYHSNFDLALYLRGLMNISINYLCNIWVTAASRSYGGFRVSLDLSDERLEF